MRPDTKLSAPAKLTCRLDSRKPVDVLTFSVGVIAVSASGVFAPGPLFVANILYGTRRGLVSGIKVAHGHAVVEIAVITAIAAGLFSIPVFLEQYTSGIAIVGGVAILLFATFQLFSVLKKTSYKAASLNSNPFVIGVVLTAFNPFFLVWWFTVGLKLIADSSQIGLLAGVALLFGLHVWMDYVWLAATAYLASKGSSVLNSKYYKILMLGLTGVLGYYGIQFLISGLG